MKAEQKERISECIQRKEELAHLKFKRAMETRDREIGEIRREEKELLEELAGQRESS